MLTGASPARGRSVLDKLNIAAIGIGGKGASDIALVSRGQNVVAICDIDEGRLAGAAKTYRGAQTFTDWRRLLDRKDIDAVTVSTPDHTHAPAAMSAILRGKHVYCQKPLTHSVYEARQLTEAAARKGVVTQMGIQHHSNTFFKTATQLIQDGAIGKVQAAHVWTDRPGTFWSQGKDRPKGSDPIPQSIHWDQWLGVAPERPYVQGAYHSFQWRAYWDFGTGALGDMGCHGIDPVATAVQLPAAKTVSSRGPKAHPDTGPAWAIIDYTFPGTQYTSKEFQLTWYDGGKKPESSLFQAPESFQIPANGILFIGTSGNLFVEYSSGPILFSGGEANGKIEMLPAEDHYRQWTNACKGEGKTSCSFSYAGPMTETVLLGNVAHRAGKLIEWDSVNLVAKNCPEALPYIRRTYRDGWKIPGLS